MMSNTTSHILLLIQCVLESCIWILFSEKKRFFSCVCNWILFSEKKIFVSCDCDWKLFSEKKIFVSCVCNWILFSEKKIFDSCDCNWILFSEKKIFVSCVCNWIYNQIYSNVCIIGYIYLGYSRIQVPPKFIAKTYLFGINDAGNNKKTITGSLIVFY